MVAVATGIALTAVVLSRSAGDHNDAARGGTAAHPGGSGVRLRPIDGGPDYYARFSPSLPADPSFFPLAVWYASIVSPEDAALDKDAGFNTYVEVTQNTDLDLVAAAGMWAIHNATYDVGNETVGWMISDEMDMWGRPGYGVWDGELGCVPSESNCGYTAQDALAAKLPRDSRLRYANYGKGVTFWDEREDGIRWVSHYQDVVSADNYWFTDEFICGEHEGGTFFGERDLAPDECHRAYNYGLTVEKVRSLVSPPRSKPVWAHVEVGHTFDIPTFPSARPEQTVAAVWSSIIHGARGIIYFNHSFAGPCVSYQALRDPCYAGMRAAVKELNGRLTTLAPVLNAPFADGVAVPGDDSIDLAAKWYDGHFYVIAGSKQAPGSTSKINMGCVGDATATVLYENRTIPIVGGALVDEFADSNAVHLYRIDGGSSCGAY